jgi:FAD:protein FMN transferase
MRNGKSIKKTLFMMILVIFSVSSCAKAPEPAEPISESRLLLGTSCRITLYEQESRALFDAAFDRIAEIEQAMSVNIIESEISQINRRSGTDRPTRVHKDTMEVLLEALEIAQASDGLFDPTIGPLVTLWGIGSDDPKVPDQQEIMQTLEKVDYRSVAVDAANSTVRLPRAGMSLDLGGIAKGYAADEVRTILREQGVESALINLGGNVLTVGKKPDGSPWKIGIQDPQSARGDYILIAALEDKAVVTSGTYERFFRADDTIYHHILDTRTGYPVVSDLLSVSIIASDSFIADALSTAVYAMGIEKGLELIESYGGIEAVFITTGKDIFVSSGLKGQGASMITLVDSSYSLTD